MQIKCGHVIIICRYSLPLDKIQAAIDQKGGESLMNKYETLYIIKPTVEEEARKALIEKFSDIITAQGAVESVEEMGMRKLAYPINYISEGYYVLVNFEAQPALPAELERNFKINENIMRYIIVRKES